MYHSAREDTGKKELKTGGELEIGGGIKAQGGEKC